MHIARVAGIGEDPCWALVDDTTSTVRRIRAPFEWWAPRVATDGEGVLEADLEGVPLSSVRLCAPRHPGSRVFGVGLNYLEHLTRLGRKEAPPHTIAYIKPDSAIVDPGGSITYPAVTATLDFEIELVAVVARALDDEPQASACLLGYTVGNDVSARDAGKQLGSLDLFSQKALDATAPLGPWITTLDAFGGPGQPEVELEMRINGEVCQHDNSRNMIFGVDELLNFLDARVRLQPGDMVFTGSTCGVGLEDGRFLQPGDRLEATIEHIGTLYHGVGPKRVLSEHRAVGRLGMPPVA